MITLKRPASLLKCFTSVKNSSDERALHSLNVVRLNRSLLSVRGSDAYQFLQGLITNDIRQFLDKFHLPLRQSIYSLLLQANGRTLADFILHNVGKVTDYQQLGDARSGEFKGDPEHALLLECDPNLKANLLRLFKVYKLRKKLELSEEDRSVWCVYSPDPERACELKEHRDDSLLLSEDPRLSHMGYRCLSTANTYGQLVEQLRSLKLIDPGKHPAIEVGLADYVRHRYRLAIGEGALDNPSGQCLPLEDNADLLNGLNFSKGCYLGQELVARTHYTGVVRKRLMPIEVIEFEGKPLSDGQTGDLKEKVKFGISLTKEENPKKRLGKIRSISSTSNLGLALLYHKDLESCNYLAANQELGLLVRVNKPIWWPAQLN